MSMKNFRTGLAVFMGGAVLVGGVLLGASMARADSSNSTQQTTPDNTTVESLGRGLCGELGDLAEQLGLTVDELRQQLQNGATLQQLADDAGVNLDAVVTKIKDDLKAEIDARVANGRLSQDQANAIKEKIDSFQLGDLTIPDLRGELRDGLGRPFLGNVRSWLDNLNLNIDLNQLRQKLQSGESLQQALTEMGVDVDSVVAQLKQEALDKIDQAVADGTITQARADRLKQMVNSFELGDVLPFGHGFHFDFGGSGGFRFPGPHGSGFHPFGNHGGHQGSAGSTTEGVSPNV
jgi:uncharacterized protein YidB (DUF937 family)